MRTQPCAHGEIDRKDKEYHCWRKRGLDLQQRPSALFNIAHLTPGGMKSSRALRLVALVLVSLLIDDHCESDISHGKIDEFLVDQ